MLKAYNAYSDNNLLKFYNIICSALNISLSKVTRGTVKNFYEQNSYKNIVICTNIVDDTSKHITIHKAKGSEYENVMLFGTKDTKDLLLNTNLYINEEHRVNYVGLSRAKRKLFIQLDELTVDEEKENSFLDFSVFS